MKLSQTDPSAGIFESVDEKDFGKVMGDVLRRYPEDPFYFLDEEKLRERVALLKKNFLPGKQFNGIRRLIYAVKANPRLRIMQIVAEAGIDGFDCASMNEITLASRFADGNDIYFNNPVKKRGDIGRAKRLGVNYFTAQTRSEVIKILGAICGIQPDDIEIVIRMITHNKSAKVDLSDKFGITEKQVKDLIRYMKKRPFISRVGISMHTGSQNGDDNSYREAIKKIAALARQLGGVQSINLGGGLPVNAENTIESVLKHYLQIINNAVRDNIEGALSGDDPKIIMEPGRSVIADSVDLVIPVISAQKREGQRCVYIDDGVFTSFSDAVVHGWEYPLKPLRPFPGKQFKPSVPTIIYGRTCDSGDCLRLRYMIPADLHEGDYIHVPCAGAYMDSQATIFNGFQPPKYISYNIDNSPKPQDYDI